MKMFMFALFALFALSFVSCEIGLNLDGEAETINTIRTDKIVYQCLDCGNKFCKDGSPLPEIPDYSYGDSDSFSITGTKCIYCESSRVNVIGEIDPDGEFVAYEY